MNDENLWGNLPVDVKITVPATILKSQALVLNKITKGLLDGRVISTRSGDPKRIGFTFRIVAPALKNYSVDLLTVFHDAAIVYPAKIRSSLAGVPPTLVETEAALKQELKMIFQSQPVQTLIASLLGQSNAESLELTSADEAQPVDENEEVRGDTDTKSVD